MSDYQENGKATEVTIGLKAYTAYNYNINKLQPLFIDRSLSLSLSQSVSQPAAWSMYGFKYIFGFKSSVHDFQSIICKATIAINHYHSPLYTNELSRPAISPPVPHCMPHINFGRLPIFAWLLYSAPVLSLLAI